MTMNKLKARPLVYVAGPYGSSQTSEVREVNIKHADDAAIKLALWGASPFIPHKNSDGWQSKLIKTEIFECDFAVLVRCDAVVVVGMATGVAAEWAFAKMLGIPVFVFWEDNEALLTWLKKHTLAEEKNERSNQ